MISANVTIGKILGNTGTIPIVNMSGAGLGGAINDFWINLSKISGLRRKTNLRDYLLLTLKETSSTAVSIIVEGALTAGVVGGKVFREGLRVELLVVGRVVANLVVLVVDMVVEANWVVVVEVVDESLLTVVEGVVL